MALLKNNRTAILFARSVLCEGDGVVGVHASEARGCSVLRIARTLCIVPEGLAHGFYG